MLILSLTSYVTFDDVSLSFITGKIRIKLMFVCLKINEIIYIKDSV